MTFPGRCHGRLCCCVPAREGMVIQAINGALEQREGPWMGKGKLNLEWGDRSRYALLRSKGGCWRRFMESLRHLESRRRLRIRSQGGDKPSESPNHFGFSSLTSAGSWGGLPCITAVRRHMVTMRRRSGARWRQSGGCARRQQPR